MQAGMTFTVEPVVAEGSSSDRRPNLWRATAGSGAVEIWEDGWTAATQQGGRGAQFEHTVLITRRGVEVLTRY